MAKIQGATPSALKGRSAKPQSKLPVTPAAKTAAPDAPRKAVSLPQFAREVRAEARKVTWTSWKETWITSVMVFIMVVLTAVFFLVVDSSLHTGIQWLLGLASKG